jgi:hypothetical protein
MTSGFNSIATSNMQAGRRTAKLRSRFKSNSRLTTAERTSIYNLPSHESSATLLSTCPMTTAIEETTKNATKFT